MKLSILLFCFCVFLFICLPNKSGAQWTKTSEPNAIVLCLLSAGADLFAGTDGEGIFLSIDSSATWTAVNTGLANTYVYCFAVSGKNIYAGTQSGVFCSTNYGASWAAMNNGLTNTPAVYALAFVPSGTGDTNLFAGTDGGVFRSTDNGESWNATNSGLTDAGSVYSLAFSSNGAGGTNLFAGAAGGVFSSTNNGTSWTAVYTTSTMPPFVRALAVSPNGAAGTNLFAAALNGGVLLSTNDGTNWTEVDTGLTNTGVHTFAVSGTTLFAGTDSGVFITTHEGVKWNPVNTGLTNTLPVYALAFVPNGTGDTNLFAGTWGGGVFRRPISEMIPSTLSSPALVSPGTGSTVSPDSVELLWSSVATATSYGIEVSSNAGFSDIVLDTNITASSSLVVHGLQYGREYYWRARAENPEGMSNWCEAWAFVTTPSVDSLDERPGYYPLGSWDCWEYQTVTAQESGPNDTSAYYVVAVGDTVMPNGFKYEILNNSAQGTFYERIDSSRGIVCSYSTQYSSDYAIDSLFAGPDDLIKCNGLTCTSIEDGLLFGVRTHLRTLFSGATGPMDFYYYYYAEGFGLYEIYQQFSSGNTVTSLVFAKINGIGYGKKIIDKVRDADEGVKSFRLSQNFPNPFNPSTVITYQLPVNTYVTLKVFDVLGREVGTLVRERQNAGSHSVSFSGDRLPSGMYFYRLQAGSYTETKKCLLLK